MDLIAVHAYLTRSYWSPEIPFEIVRTAAENSLCFGIKVDGQQVAFARVITDKATFAYLSDVYVVEEHRGRGLSHRMMERITQHADLQKLRRFMLVTRDAHSLYSRYGFEVASTPRSNHGGPEAGSVSLRSVQRFRRNGMNLSVAVFLRRSRGGDFIHLRAIRTAGC